MKRLLLSLVAAPMVAFSQTPAVLIEACNSMQDSAKRLECLKAAMGADKAPAKRDLIDPVRRAFGNMQASLDVGVSYNNYQLAILDLAKAVSAFKQDAGAGGVDIAHNFDAALDAYSDAGTFWERSISFYARRDNEISYGGGLPIGLNGLEWLVSKYSLATSKSDMLGIHRGLPVQETRAVLWRIAKERAAKGYTSPTQASIDAVSAQLVLSYSQADIAPDLSTAEKIAKGASCSATPLMTPAGGLSDVKEFSTRCDDGLILKVACFDGVCRGNLIKATP